MATFRLSSMTIAYPSISDLGYSGIRAVNSVILGDNVPNGGKGFEFFSSKNSVEMSDDSSDSNGSGSVLT